MIEIISSSAWLFSAPGIAVQAAGEEVRMVHTVPVAHNHPVPRPWAEEDAVPD